VSNPTSRSSPPPPLLVIEIVSRTDSVHDLNQKIADYRAFGVHHIWIIDPYNRGAMHYTQDGVQEVRDGYLRLPEADVIMPLGDVLPKRK
jgi:Uma2 family endonuclease